MPISFHCETCRRSIRVPDGSEGKLTRCPECYSIVQIPFQSKKPKKTAKQTVPSEDPLGIEGDIHSRWDEVYGHVEPRVDPETSKNQFADDPVDSLPEPPAREQADNVKLSPEVVDRRLRHLVLATSALVLASIVATVSVAVGLGYCVYMIVMTSTYELTTLLPGVIIAIVLGLHIWTLTYLIQARLRGDYSRSVIGTALSLIPPFNLAAFFSFPFSLWVLTLLAHPQIRMHFQGEGDELDYLREEQFERRRQRLILIANVLFIGCIIVAVLQTMALWSAFATMAANGIGDPSELAASMGMLFIFILHLATIYCLNEARTLGNYQLAVIGIIASILPPANIPAILLFPLSIWGTLLIMNAQMRTQFYSYWDRVTE